MPSGLDSLSDLTPQALALWADPNMRLMLVLLVGAGILFAWRPGGSARAQTRREERAQIKRAKNTSLWRRLMWKVKRPHDLMKVDGLELDRTGDRSHCLWVGPTGRGKSQSVATVRCAGERPWLAVMPDLSLPLREKADFIWTAGESTRPVDFLKGTSDDVAHFLTEVFRSGGEGVWKRAAFMATKRIVQQIDADGTPRSLLLIGTLLEQMCRDDAALRRMCEAWVTRFLGAAEAMGDSVGPGGIDIAEYLKAGKNVVIDNNAWKRPGLKGDVVAFGLAEGKRIADLVPGGFRLIFEEADQLGERIDLADPFFTAGRLRQVAVDALVHSEHKLPDAMVTNSATRVYFRPNKPEHRKKVAEALDLSEGEVDAIPDYHAWIEHDGKIRRLVHFPKPKDARPPVTAGDHPFADGESVDERMGRRGRYIVAEIATPRHPGGVLALPPPSTGVQRLLKSIYPEGECERWAGKHDRDGYGLVWLDGRWQKVHRVRWELAYGPIALNPDGTRITVDHQRTCAKDCSKLSHLTLCTRGENSQRRWRVRGR